MKTQRNLCPQNKLQQTQQKSDLVAEGKQLLSLVNFDEALQDSWLRAEHTDIKTVVSGDNAKLNI